MSIEVEQGDKVNYHSVINPQGPITSTDHIVKSIELEPNNYGTNVAWITGKSGCVAIDALSFTEDCLYDKAVAFVIETRRASISSLQRKLRIGYNKAARMIERMEAEGVVSEMGNQGQRQVLAKAQ